jgi:hypothetical protein
MKLSEAWKLVLDSVQEERKKLLRQGKVLVVTYVGLNEMVRQLYCNRYNRW